MTCQHLFDQFGDAIGVFRRDRRQIANAKGAKGFGVRREFVGIDLVDRKEEMLAGALQQAREFHVRTGDFAASVNDHDDGAGFVEGDSRLAEDFRRDKVLVLGDDAAGIDHAKAPTVPAYAAVKAVARDARFVANNGATHANHAVEERGLAYVRASHDGEQSAALVW